MGRPKLQVSFLGVFRAPRILTLEQLSEKLGLSRSTVLRRLQEHGYFSSYNLAGKFLSIPEVIDFDAHGLWTWQGARFSRQGTLKETVAHFVATSPRGMTQQELLELLGVRTHNVLLDLVQEKRIRRQDIGSAFVYFSADSGQRQKQIRQRESFLERQPRTVPNSRQVIATLLELIQNPVLERQQIVTRCQRAGVSLSLAVVDNIFRTYDLEKKGFDRDVPCVARGAGEG
jgi:hypothetical protein